MSISEHPLIEAEYDRLRSEGLSHNLAEMFALQTPPMSNSDREFMEGRVNGNQFEKQAFVGDFLKAKAKAAGVNTAGKYYMHGLAAYPGDPRAWISDRGDVARIVAERGWGSEGSVKATVRPAEGEASDIGVAEDIVESRAARLLQKNPEMRIDDAKEKAFNEAKPKWSKAKYGNSQLRKSRRKSDKR